MVNSLLANNCRVGLEPGRRYWIQLSDINWWIVALIYSVAAVLAAGTVYTSELASGHPLPYLYPALWEFTGHSTVLALVPLVVLGFSRIPIQRNNWYYTVPVHLLLSLAFGATHTLLMLYTRRGLYALLGLGVYDYGQMGYRFAMEYHKQFIHYWAVFAVLRAIAYYRQSRERERQAAELELTASELQRRLALAQVQALRSQLNPHFLFNTLNMISSVMYEDLERADRMLSALSRMLRMSLEEHVGTRVALRRELGFVACAVELIEGRFQDRVAIQIHSPPDAADALVPHMLLYTLFENAIKHHDFDRDPVIRVEIRIERNDGTLELHILDNGPGIEDVPRAMGAGVGLSNTRQRLLALYGSEHRFELANRPEGGLHARVVIPLEAKAVLQPA